MIHTPRLTLRPFIPADAADVFAYAANPNVSRYTTWETHRTIADSEAFIAMVLRRGPRQHTWAICLRGEPTVIGAIEFGMVTETEADFHYVLAEPFWNLGLMTEAAQAVVAWGLARYPAIRRVATSAASENVGSLRVMEKCGLRFERKVYDRWQKLPDPVEVSEYAMFVGETDGRSSGRV